MLDKKNSYEATKNKEFEKIKNDQKVIESLS
jgi:hypothetical protein